MKKNNTRRRLKNTAEQMQLWSLAFPAIILVFIFSYLPMGGIIIAFKNYRYDTGIFGSEWVNFKNFEVFFKSDDFMKITFNTLYMNLFFIILGTAISVFVAILL